MATRIANGIVIAIAMIGCRGVPELAFDQDAADDAGSAADASAARDAGSDGTALVDAKSDEDAGDASISEDAKPFEGDASDAGDRDAPLADSSLLDSSLLDSSLLDSGAGDASSADGGAITCPAGPPPGASVCCKSVPCHGDTSSCNSQCTNCSNNCAGKTCCLDGNGNYHGCANTPADCSP